MKRAAALLLAGCSAAAPIAPADFASAVADASCAAGSRCVPQSAGLEKQCRDATLAQFGDDVPRAIAAGRIVYDAAQARACADALAAAPCVPGGVAEVDESPCFAALRGTVAAGAACASLFECAEGMCEAPSCTCPQALGEGAACSVHQSACDPRQGLICSDEGVCLRPGGAGAACQLNVDCAPGWVCVGGRCASLRREGAGCSADESCAAGLYCSGGTCLVRKGRGSGCGGDIDAALRGAECAQDLLCVGAGLTLDGQAVAGRCGAAALEGGPCSAEQAGMQVQITGCADGLSCAGGTCVDAPLSAPEDPPLFCHE